MFPRSPFRTHRTARAIRIRRVRPAASRPPMPLAVVVPVLGLVLGASLNACGESDEVTMPPLTPEPGDPFPTTAPAASPGSAAAAARTRAARVVLYRYLRGIASGDVSVCALLAPSYDRATFGAQGGCRTGLARVRSALPPEDLTALRGVTVPTAEAGPGDGEVTVRFEDLRWRTGPAARGGVLKAEYTLRLTGSRWLIVG